MGGTFGLEARERGAPATARGPPSLSSRSSLRVAKQAAAGSGRRLLDALLQAPLKLRKQAGKRFSTWLGMYWVLQGQNSGARGGGAKPALTRARGEEKKDFTSVGHECGAPPQHRNSTLRFDAPGIPRKKMHARLRILGGETQSINSDLRFRKSPLGRPQGEELVSPERTRERSKGLSTPTHGAQEAALTNSSESVVLSQDHRSLRVFSRANFLSATSGAYQTQGPTLTLLKV